MYPQPYDTISIYKYLFASTFLLNNKLEVAGKAILGDITTKQWLLLAILGEFFKEPPTITEVAKISQMSHQNIKQVALRLESKGYLKLAKDPKDKRAIRIYNGEKLGEFEAQMDQVAQLFLTQLFEGISPPKAESALHIVYKMLHNLETLSKENPNE